MLLSCYLSSAARLFAFLASTKRPIDTATARATIANEIPAIILKFLLKQFYFFYSSLSGSLLVIVAELLPSFFESISSFSMIY